ncbi:hypothetical protein XANCAGTX0491_010020 [Xanthoria calcicola]
MDQEAVAHGLDIPVEERHQMYDLGIKALLSEDACQYYKTLPRQYLDDSSKRTLAEIYNHFIGTTKELDMDDVQATGSAVLGTQSTPGTPATATPSMESRRGPGRPRSSPATVRWGDKIRDVTRIEIEGSIQALLTDEAALEKLVEMCKDGVPPGTPLARVIHNFRLLVLADVAVGERPIVNAMPSWAPQDQVKIKEVYSKILDEEKLILGDEMKIIVTCSPTDLKKYLDPAVKLKKICDHINVAFLFLFNEFLDDML